MAGDGIDPTATAEFCEYLLGEHPQGLSDQQVAEVVEWGNEHYYAGVAVGLLLNAATFLEDGRSAVRR